jgi:hypothetical protein
MGRKRTPGLEWLEPNDPEQLRWAATYLATRGLLEKHEHPKNRPFGEQVTYEDLVRIGRRLLDKKILFKDMKDAWYQKKSCARESSKKTFSFTLRKETRIKLKELAGGGSASATLETLIDKAYKAKMRKDQRLAKKPEITPQEERKFTIPEIRTLMIGEEPPTLELEAKNKENFDSDLTVTHSQQTTDTTADTIEKPPIDSPEEKAEIQNNEHITTEEESNSLNTNKTDDDYEKDLATQDHQVRQEKPETPEGNQENNGPTKETEEQQPRPKLIIGKRKTFIMPDIETIRAPEID